MIDNIDIPKHIINKIIENALAEDLGSLGDITSKSLSNKKGLIVYDMRNILSHDKMKKEKIKYFSIGK